MPQLSVIVPVYGVEKYIKRCAESLFSQSFQDIEYIFVDDCSPDNSVKILQDVVSHFPEVEDRVKIIRQKQNQGAAEAKWTGVRVASGEYIAFCDSDDWVEPSMYEKLLRKAHEQDYDMVFCNYSTVTEGSGETVTHVKKSSNINSHYLIYQFCSGGLYSCVWRMITKKTVFTDNSIIYPQAHMIEDRAMLIQLVYYANKIAWIEDVLYNYVIRPGSIIGNHSEANMLRRYKDVMANTAIIIDFLNHTNLPNKEACIINSKLYPRLHIAEITTSNSNYRLWRNIYPEIEGHVLRNKSICKAYRIRYFLTMIRLLPFLKKLGVKNNRK